MRHPLEDLRKRVERLENIVERVIRVLEEEIEKDEPLLDEVQVSGVPYKVKWDQVKFTDDE